MCHILPFDFVKDYSNILIVFKILAISLTIAPKRVQSPKYSEPDMKEQIVSALRGLPQINRIRREDASRWIKHVAERQPNRILWLMKRLGDGFGGSETGALVLDAMGRPAPFSPASELVNEKLMRVLPTPTNRFMRKGIILEEAVTQATLRLYGGEFDHATLDAFGQPCPNDPFGLAGNPDFPWIRADGVRTLVDIKVPGSGEESLSDGDKQFLYMAQLNTYNRLSEARDLPKFDQLLNIHLELPPVLTDAFTERLSKGGRGELPAVVNEMVQLLKYEREGMRLHMVEQPINPSIDFNGKQRPIVEVIEEVVAINWQAVLDGNVPELAPRADIGLDETQKSQLAQLEAELVQLQALQAVTEKKLAQRQEQVNDLVASVTKEGKLAQTPHVNIKRTASVNMPMAEHLLQRYGLDSSDFRPKPQKPGVRDYDTLAMAEKLKQEGIDVAPFVRPGPFDSDRLVSALEDLGEDPSRVIEYGTAFSKSRKKESHQYLAQLEEQLSPSVEATLQTYRASNAEYQTSSEPAPKKSAAPSIQR